MERQNSQTSPIYEGAPLSLGRSILEFILELVKVTVICAAIIILIRWLLFQPFYVKGSSMEPNYFDGDYLIIYELPYHFPETFNVFGEKSRGIPIIFHPPSEMKEFYIKRIIGLPGERVVLKDGRIFIYNKGAKDGFLLEELYLGGAVETSPGYFNDVTLGQNEIYVLGDNRGRSLDSRRLGAIPIKNIVGRPVFRGWPFERIGIIKNSKSQIPNNK